MRITRCLASFVLAIVSLVGLLFTPKVAAADCWSFDGLDMWAGVVQQVLNDGRGHPAGAVVTFTTIWVANPGDTLQVEGQGRHTVFASRVIPVWGTVWANPACVPVGFEGYQPNPGDRTMSLIQEAEAEVVESTAEEAPPTAEARTAVQQPQAALPACPSSPTDVARILLEWKSGQPEDEANRLARELTQLASGNGWRFVASSAERARALMAHDTRVVDVNGVRHSQPGVWSPKTTAGTIWLTHCEPR